MTESPETNKRGIVMSVYGMGPDGDQPGDSPLNCLTVREREVADYITRGRSNKYIAAELGVSQRTIEAHRARIFTKIGVRNAVELTQRCVRWHMKLPATDDLGAGVRGGTPAGCRVACARRHPAIRRLAGGVGEISLRGRPGPVWRTALK